MLVPRTISKPAHRITAVPLPPFAMVLVPMSLMIGGLGPSRNQGKDDGTGDAKPSARIVSCGAPQWQRCSPLPTGREGRLPCPSPIQQISRVVPADRVKSDAYASEFCHTRFLQRLTPTRWSSPRALGPSARMGNPRGSSRGAEGPVIGGITIRNQAKTISSTG